jgi:hypothetical protein
LGLVVAPSRAVSARGPSARKFLISQTGRGGGRSALASGSLSREAGKRSLRQTRSVRAREPGNATTILRKAHAVDISPAKPMSIGHTRKVE